MNRFSVLKLSSEIEMLEIELNRMGPDWNLIQLIPAQEITSLSMNGQPHIKTFFIGIFSCYIDEFENKE